MTVISEAHVLDEPGLYWVTSSSPTSYFVDTREPDTPMYMRWHGAGISLASPMDNTWHDLIKLTSAPELAPDIATDWVLTVGRFHAFYTTREADHPNGPLYWVTSRVCEQIRRIEAMPSPFAREKTDAWLPPDRMFVLVAVAVPHEDGWLAFVPDFPGLSVRVGNLDAAHYALTLHAAVLTGRDQRDFLVSVHRVPNTDVQP